MLLEGTLDQTSTKLDTATRVVCTTATGTDARNAMGDEIVVLPSDRALSVMTRKLIDAHSKCDFCRTGFDTREEWPAHVTSTHVNGETLVCNEGTGDNRVFATRN